LGIEFREIAAPIRARETSLKFEEIHNLLVSHENYLRQLEQQSANSFVPTANYSNRWTPQLASNSRQSKWRPPVSFSTPRGHNGTHRNESFNSGHRRFKPKCQWCDQLGHTAKQCPKMSASDFSANCAASSQPKNHKWLVDSAASHNMTTDLSNLTINSEYDGTDEVVIGDGSGLPVSHIGSLSLKTSNHVFHLRDTLCVPTIHKNLISVYHFTKHNNVYIEFHPTYFLVKDRITGALLLKGNCEDGVYPFPKQLPSIKTNIIAYVHERSTFDRWHKRLGHPSPKLVNHLIHAFSLPTNKTGSSSLCTSCSQNKAHHQSFSTHGLTSTTSLELIYTDVWGPSHDLGINGFKYYVIFVDHYTKYIWLYPMTHKSNVQTIFP
jgi:hypothetical protein